MALAMSLVSQSPLSCTWSKLKGVGLNPLSQPCRGIRISRSSCCRLGFNANSRRTGARACFLNPIEDPIIKEALKEPVAFMGGMFAGLLRLDLEEEPLKEWVARTVEAAGISEEEIDAEESTTEAAPQQIEIE
ncbi:hypothetical protein L6164_006257 [Bauhinia variegata]|uniref:Uncharacterized protein n=1 Tax=Bauhinia variegata TaxID=167791 RepID=A0ACB9PT21_BAUVA|nr:hypothetical protein L6164_006257 [Bauhinia variegata]